MAASAVVPLSLGVSEPAPAQVGCSGLLSATICPSAGNSYPNGINADATNLLNGFTNSINLRLLSGVNVDILGAAGINAVNAANSTGVTSGSADIRIITADGVTITNTAFPGGNRSEEHTSELQSLRHLVC